MSKRYLIIGCVILLGIGLGWFSLLSGEISLSSGDVFSALFNMSDSNEVHRVVVFDLRLPRLILILIIGGGLAVCGASMQGIFRNPLVEPGLIGVSSGAALFAVMYIVLFKSLASDFYNNVGIYGMPLVTFLGALITTTFVYRIGLSGRNTNVTFIILAGIAVNAFCMACTGIILFFADATALREFTFWSFGSFSSSSWAYVIIAVVFVGVPALLLQKSAKILNLFTLGEREVAHLGFEPESFKRKVILLTAIAVGGAVSMVGVIGFVGLLVPHLTRLIMGADNRKVLPYSMLIGAVILLFADIISRSLLKDVVGVFFEKNPFEGVELPIGMIMSFLGAPFFLMLLFRTKKKSVW